MFLSFDLETDLIGVGYQAPVPVCASWTSLDDPQAAELTPLWDANGPAPGVIDWIRSLFEGVTLFGVNIAFDVACLLRHGFIDAPAVFRAYDEGRILDLGTLERLAEIGAWTGRKKLSLAMLSQVYGAGELDKDPAVRLSYGPLIGEPLSSYSDRQIEYALNDAIAGALVCERQLHRWIPTLIDPFAGPSEDRVHLADWQAQSRKAFWLRLTSNEGMTTDPILVDRLIDLTIEALESLGEIAREFGLIRADGSKDMKAIREAVSAAYDGRPPMTEEPRRRPPGAKPFVPQVKTGHDVLDSSGDPLLELFAEYGQWAAVANKDLKFLREPRVHTKFGLADTLRGTSSAPNLQNLRRKAGIRECFKPLDGRVYVAADHGGLELATLAQCCVSLLGRYDMSNKLNRGEDLHLHVASEILGISYAEALERKRAGDKEVKNARQVAKVVNFGRPGGMAARTLVIYARQSYGVTLTEAQAKDLIQSWNRANPDGMAFLDYVHTLQRGERFEVTIPGSTVVRRGCTYCAACNTHFQGLGAVLEAAVGYEIARAIEVGGLPARLVNFVHDEFILECLPGDVTHVAAVVREIMCSAAKPYLPDVRIDAEPVAMVRWTKAAEPKRAPDGRLLIWGLDYE